jgi:peptidoglycan/LPS O-acetylase OafA/YrhL
MAVTSSLAVEEQFYLLLPAVIWVVFPRRLLPTVLVLIVLVPLLRIFLFLFHSSLFLYVLFPCRADALLLGVLCAGLLRGENSRAWLAQNAKILYALLLCLLAGVGYVISLGYGYSAKRVFDSFDMAAFGFTAVALFYACVLLVAVSQPKSVIAGWLRSRLLRHFGMIAYGMYLMHFAVRAVVQAFIFGTGANSASTFLRNEVSVLAFLVTWLLAVLSWRYFEQPIVRWGHSFRYAEKKADSEVAASARTI